ncbi:MAG: beta-ketoacyl-[acyl-carrier-protein] synthase family protein [Desulfovibrionaceae bacterium]|nr:beta-ketoacyl-[acyl-carrier-protein] synthase family protein [Desulfovibrionaceae bacterium]
MDKCEPVAITGIGSVCALGLSLPEIREGLYRGTRFLSSAKKLSPDALDFPIYAVPDSAWQDGRSGLASDTLHLGLEAARQAMAQARWPAGVTAAVVAGTTSGTALHFLEGYRASREGTAHDEDRRAYLHSNPALVMAERLNIHGPRLTISNACTSGADALGLGVDMIRSGQISRALCGGADALSMVPHTGFARLLVTDAEPCRPFDVSRAGLNLGEGAAFMCLESLKSACGRNAAIQGYILGYGAHCDAHHFTAPHPEAEGLMKALHDALAQAGKSAADMAFVNVHGTGTRENDRAEGKLLARELPGVPIWATKALTGHTLGAAGALEAVFTLVALQNRQIPASVGFAELDPEIGAEPARAGLALTRNAALSTSLGFGGTNAVLILATGREHE